MKSKAEPWAGAVEGILEAKTIAGLPKPFTHQSLDLEESSVTIRLLDILLWQGDGILQCEIHHASLRKCQQGLSSNKLLSLVVRMVQRISGLFAD